MTSPPFFRGFRCAIIFLTRIPVGGDGYRDEDWNWSTGWFPAVGFLIGLILAGLWTLCSPELSPLVIAALILSVSQLLTGGFHEDGLADTADALGGAYTPERVLVILKDSRVGAFGAMALFCALLLRVALWVELSAVITTALVLSQGLSRVVPIWLMRALPYVTQGEAAKSRLMTRARLPQLCWATLCGLLALLTAFQLQLISGTQLVLIVAMMFVSTALCYWRFRARVGGITGDFLGAAQQISECAILLALAWTTNL